MAKKYGKDARLKRLHMLSQAAYDSVPSDLTVALAAKLLSEAGEKVITAETHHILKGGAMPVGTLNTIFDIVLKFRRQFVKAVTFGLVRQDTKKANQNQMNENSSLHKHFDELHGLVPNHIKKNISNDLFWNSL